MDPKSLEYQVQALRAGQQALFTALNKLPGGALNPMDLNNLNYVNNQIQVNNGPLLPITNAYGQVHASFPKRESDLNDMTTPQLDELCVFYGLPTGGARKAIMSRFLQFIGVPCAY